MVTLRELRAFAYRINPEEPQKPYGRLFFRPISLYLTWICLNLGLSANQVTIAQLLVGIAGAAAVACPELWVGLLGLLLFQFGYMLDNIDGEIARYRKEVSLTGKFLDEVGHQSVVPLMYLGFATGGFLRHGHWEMILFAALAGLFSLRIDLLAKAEVIVHFGQSRLNSRFDFYKQFPKKKSALPDAVKPRLIRLLHNLFAYPALMNILAILWLLDRFAGTRNILFGEVGLVYLLIVANGILVPIRRALTIRSVALASQVEKDYVELKEAISTDKDTEKTNNPVL